MPAMKYRRDVIVKHGCFIGENDDYPQVTLVKVYRMQGVIEFERIFLAYNFGFFVVFGTFFF